MNQVAKAFSVINNRTEHLLPEKIGRWSCKRWNCICCWVLLNVLGKYYYFIYEVLRTHSKRDSLIRSEIW